jgi:hypothetical protein
MVSIRKGFDDGDYSEKILRLTTYDLRLFPQVHLSEVNKTAIERSAAKLVTRYFEQYADAMARSNPKPLQHVYEFNMAGDQKSRLFKSTIATNSNGSVISYRFIKAKVPNNFGYMFYNKAEVMERGNPIVIMPKSKQYLSYKLDNGRFIRSKKSVVNNPGGDVGGNFNEEFDMFMKSRAKAVLKEFRFFEKVNNTIRAKRKISMMKINSNSVKNSATLAVADARQVAVQTEVRY